ncbi:hypothetical protein GOODEAATRI_011485 [Goodea atripinnis]|uniref:Mitochondrial carrier protein n=1 Tax=Goodea atripinnis TaxID=208336 RepID=A0ABV0PN70_9TELE
MALQRDRKTGCRSANGAETSCRLELNATQHRLSRNSKTVKVTEPEFQFTNGLITRCITRCTSWISYLDRLQVRIQTQKQFTGVYQCAVHGFFKGMSLPLTTVSLTSSVVFGTYRNCLQCMKQARGADWSPSTKLEVFLAGMAGGVAQVKETGSQTTSCDIVKVRLQCQTESMREGARTLRPKYHGAVHCLLSIVKDEGFRGLYRGALPLMLRDGPSYATYFLTYATMDGARGPKQYTGFFHCIVETVRVEGAAVFFRSLGINCLRAFPVNMVVFLTYEVLSGFLRTGPESVDSPNIEWE